MISRTTCLLLAVALMAISTATQAARIGVDNIHGFNADAFLASGSNNDDFRAEITGAGHTIVPLNSFSATDFASLDAVILNTPYDVNASNYSNSEITAIQSFANQRAVFVDDSSIFSDTLPGSDRPLSFGDNRRLLQNILGFISSGNGALFIGENGSGFDIGNMNNVVAPYGVSFSGTAIDAGGHTVTGFVPHPVTAGLQQIGVDFHLPMTISGPAMDLTTGGGPDNVLAVFEIPEPTSLLLGALGALCVLTRRSR